MEDSQHQHVASNQSAHPDIAKLRGRYEEVAYPGHAYRAAHPDRLYAVATCLGLSPPAPDSARILELGCGDGMHCLAMATTLPGAQIHGVDLSETILRPGHGIAQDLALKNLTLQASSLEQFTSIETTYDYIIAHGVWSWVPQSTRESIFEIIGSYLSENGVAYVSYNTLPGWNLRGMIRQAIQWRVRDIDSPEEQIAESRHFVAMMAETVEHREVSHERAWTLAHERFATASDAYIFHDYLSPFNEAVHFLTFIQRADAHGLSYLGEARYGDMLTARSPMPVTGLDTDDEPIHQEQLLDFIRGRSFRRTLLTHRHQVRHTGLHPLEAIPHLWLTLHGRPTSRPEAEQDVFETNDGVVIECDSDVSRIVLHALYESHPLPMSFTECLERVRTQISGTEDVELASEVACLMTDCFHVGLVDIQPPRTRLAREVEQHPYAYPLARYQAMHGISSVTNYYQQLVHLDSYERTLIGLCDGKRDHEQLLSGLIAASNSGALRVEISGSAMRDADMLESVFQATIDEKLKALHVASLLIQNDDSSDAAA